MKIAHLCLSCFYIDGHSYQENILVKQNVQDGHDVKIIASTESINSKGKMIFLKPSEYLGDDGAFVYRVSYSRFIPKSIQHKIRSYENVINILITFKPDIIYFHGISSFELRTLVKYKKNNPNVKLIADCHSDKYNSALNLQSRILHKYFYKPVFKSVESYLDKIFCISLETMDFALDYYDAPREKVEFYPLGGKCLDDHSYNIKRVETRRKFNVDENKILFVQTGKMTVSKKLIESLEVFSQINDNRFVYIIAGVLDDSIENRVMSLVESDDRIKYLGWLEKEDMQNLLCASDIYVQPGSQSATMQQSLCLRNAVILDNVKSHIPFVKGNGWLIDNMGDMKDILNKISEGNDSDVLIKSMSMNSFNIAKKILDYKILAKKIYEV